MINPSLETYLPTSSELRSKHSYSSTIPTLPSEQSWMKGRLIVLTILINVSVDLSKPFIDNKYVAQIVYEDKVKVLNG